MFSTRGRVAHRFEKARRPVNLAMLYFIAQERAERGFHSRGNGVEAADKILFGQVAQNSPALPRRREEVKQAFVRARARDIRNPGMERR